jgi:hypothetical protein
VPPLTDAALKTMLQNLGYSVEESKSASGGVNYFINLAPMEGWKIVTLVNISPDKHYVWLIAYLFPLPEGKTAPSEALTALLAENENIGPLHFSFSKSTKKFYLNDPIPNQNITPVFMRSEIEQLNKILARTESMWNPDKWAGATKPPAK